MQTAAETPQWDVRAPQGDVHGSSVEPRRPRSTMDPGTAQQHEHPSEISALMDNRVTQQPLVYNVEGGGHLDRREYLHATAASKAAA
jgi:hypothetical protein